MRNSTCEQNRRMKTASDFDHVSDGELREMFADPRKKEGTKQKGGVNRQMTLDELLTSPLSGIFEVRLGHASILRAAGNENFKMGSFARAVLLYERALLHCSIDIENMSVETLKIRQQMYEGRDPVYLNLARCYLKVGRFRDCVNSALCVSRTEGEEEERFPVPVDLKLKALVIAANGYIELGEYETATNTINSASACFDSVVLSDTGAKDKLGIIVASLPTLRQSIKVRSARDRQKERDTWRGALWGRGAGDGGVEGVVGQIPGSAVQAVSDPQGLATLLQVMRRRPLLAGAVLVLLFALAGALWTLRVDQRT